MRPGDIVLVRTSRPHIASVTADFKVICEDGTVMDYDEVSMTKQYDALEIVKSLESEVLRRHESG